jgi:hypothetical protein
MRHAALPLVLLLVLTSAHSAGAQGLFCLNQQSGQIDPQATQAFADMAARMDSQLAQAMSGTWYSETTAAQTGQISRLYLSYTADGQLTYQNQVCDASGACSAYQGSGAWAAMALGGGGFSGIQLISDQGRTQECTGFSGQFLDADTIQSGAGGIARRVQ